MITNVFNSSSFSRSLSRPHPGPHHSQSRTLAAVVSIVLALFHYLHALLHPFTHLCPDAITSIVTRMRLLITMIPAAEVCILAQSRNHTHPQSALILMRTYSYTYQFTQSWTRTNADSFILMRTHSLTRRCPQSWTRRNASA